MADSKITDLAADASPTADDITVMVDDVAGTPTNKKVTLANLVTKAHGLSNTAALAVAGGAITAATTTGTGSTLALDTSPVFVTPTLGVASATSVATNGSSTQMSTNGYTANAGYTSGSGYAGAANSLTTGAVLNASSSSNNYTGIGIIRGTYSGTNSGVVALFQSTNASSSGNAVNISQSGTGLALNVTGNSAFSGTINKLTLTQPATGSTVTIVDGKTFTVSNTMTLSGTDGVTMNVSNNKIAVIPFLIDGGGSTITTGIKGDLEIPFACTINSATLLADQSGSIVVDVWKDTYANYPPTGGDSITAAAKPTISTATKSQDTSLVGWTTSIAAGDILRFNVDSVTTITRVTLSLKVTKT